MSKPINNAGTPHISPHSVLDAEPDGRIRWFQKKYPLRTKKEERDRKNGAYYENCIYYYWFEYLKLSEKYRKACDNDGKGMLRIYENFGNVFEMSFWDWWESKDEHGHDRGPRLFGDKLLNKMESFISIDEVESYKELVEKGEYKLLAIPVDATKYEILCSVGLLLNGLRRKVGRGKASHCTKSIIPKSQPEH